MHASTSIANPIEFLGYKAKKASRASWLSHYHRGVLGWWFLDSISAMLMVLCAWWLSPARPLQASIHFDPRFSAVGLALVYALIFPIVSHIFGFHNPLIRRDKLVLAVKYLGVATLAVTLLSLVELMLFYTRVGRYVLLNTFILSCGGMIAVRLVLWRLSDETKRMVMVLGSSALSEHLVNLINKTGIPYELVPLDRVNCVRKHGPGQPLPCFESFNGHCLGCGIQEIVACYTEETPRNDLAGLAHSTLSGFQVSDYTSFVERTFFKVPVEQIAPEWFFQINTSGDYALFRGAKRMADIILAASGMVLTAPVLLLAAVLIKLESPGRVFYSQVRVGQFGRPFKIWKLRSMRSDAEKHGAQWAQQHDARVTRFGLFLRKTRLDEVPQFFNVFRGEMSFVGPRPERPEFVSGLAKEIPFYQQRHLLKPGITGWAQINYPYGATTADALNKLEYDLYYIKHASPLLDFQTILRTIGAVMKGAR
jgi:exopolysaccharide biosynthesis polyprenyl glycosylphosphotransferase